MDNQIRVHGMIKMKRKFKYLDITRLTHFLILIIFLPSVIMGQGKINPPQKDKSKTIKTQNSIKKSNVKKNIPDPKVIVQTTPIIKEEEIFVAVEQPGEFPGGHEALITWLSNNIRYPEEAKRNEIPRESCCKICDREGWIYFTCRNCKRCK